MTEVLPHMPAARVFRHHWIAFLWQIAAIAFFLVLGSALMPFLLLLGLGLLGFAIGLAFSVMAVWSWRTYTFPGGNQLILQQGPFGCRKMIVSLYGVLYVEQVPLLGTALDEGSVLLRVVPGDQIEVAHIGHFAAFYQALLAAARPPGYQVVGPPLPMPDQPDGWPHQWQ